MKIKCKGAFLFIFIAFAVIVSFNIPRRDLRGMSQVAGIALDLVDGEIIATFELFDPEVDLPIGSKRAVIQSRGKSIKECVEQVGRVHSMELYLDDAAALILNSDQLHQEVFSFYSLLSNDHMDLPVFYSKNQSAAEIFEGSGEVLSIQLADSAELMGSLQTVRDVMNGAHRKIYVQGRGNYEILF